MNTLRSLLHAALLAAVVALGLAGPALAQQQSDPDLAEEFRPIARDLTELEEQIVAELRADRGRPVDLGGYYHADPEKVAAVMRPSATLNRILG